MIEITSNATSANLACGFDCFGISLSMANTFKFEEFDDAIIVNNYADTIRNKENLVIQSLYHTLDVLGKKLKGVRLDIKTGIPLSRGLGSSASCISAGVLAGYLLTGNKPDFDEIFDIACIIEGHPDNLAPNIFGGARMSFNSDGKFYQTDFIIPEKYVFLAIIPDYTLSTQKSRNVLPDSYSREDVVFNISRAAMLVKGFYSSDDDLIAIALDDKIHQPYRFPLIKNYEQIRKVCMRNAALGTYLSGAGPSIMAICSDKKKAVKIANELSSPSYRCVVMTLNNMPIQYTCNELHH